MRLRAAVALVLLACPGETAAQDAGDERVSFLRSDRNPLHAVGEAFGAGNYLAPLQVLHALDPFDDPLLDSLRGQVHAQWLSYVGDFVGAEAAFGEPSPERTRVDHRALATLLDDTTPVDARAAVRALAADRRFVLVNEAHHVPATRMLTTALLRELREDGFRYLALEALRADDVARIRAAGRPVQVRRGYLADPVLADLIRLALELGYTLIAYEDEAPCEARSNDPIFCVNRRERAQASNLMLAVEHDPGARVLVHCGYDHVNERTEGGWTHMAEWLRELTGEDPLTVDQTRMRGRFDASVENPYYAAVADRLGVPTVFELDGARPWVEPERIGVHDVTVFLPRPDLAASRAQSLGWFGLRRPTAIVPCALRSATLIQAFASVAGDLSEEVPVDQFILAGDEDWVLWLRPGAYVLRALDAAGRAVPGWNPALVVPG